MTRQEIIAQITHLALSEPLNPTAVGRVAVLTVDGLRVE